MNFIEAIRHLKKGKKICRPSWVGEAALHIGEGMLGNDVVFLRTTTGYESQEWQIRVAEIEANDWMIYKDKNARGEKP